MAGMNAAIEIERPVEAVFAFFLDLERNIMATDPTVESVVTITDGPFGPGTAFILRQPVFGKVREQAMRVIALDANRSIEMEAAFGPVRPRFRLMFEPTAAGTRVTLHGDSRPVGPLRLVPFLMDRVGQRNWNRRLRLMKTVLEADATPGASDAPTSG
jgi:hypothetical protein